MENIKQIKSEMLELLKFIKRQRIDIANGVDGDIRLIEIINAYFFNKPQKP